ncbi:MAG: hypothetical protein KF744_08165 [Taibaiella sp.]|nr:hypothetical protein [Taibaiella sp.]
MKLRGFTILVFVLGTMIVASSCVKSFTCQCQVKYSGAPGLPDSTVNEYEIVDSKKKAESLCKDRSYEKEANGVKLSEVCKLY